jgi:hypothetical protein
MSIAVSFLTPYLFSYLLSSLISTGPCKNKKREQQSKGIIDESLSRPKKLYMKAVKLRKYKQGICKSKMD